jgi:phosphoribosylglycinamide formyltransferase 1
MLNLAVFASGSGSNLQAIIDAIAKEELNAKIKLVISNNSDAFALERAKKHKIPALHLSSATHPESGKLIDSMLIALESFEVDTIALAGYMKKVPNEILAFVNSRVVNIHPALLPKFGGVGMYGINVHQAVIQAKEEFSGATVHLVDNIYDNGRILAQKQVKVSPVDTPESLAKKVLKIEHTLYPQTLQKISTGEIVI